eukprot:3444354-Rhodomonas_salina.7
MAVHAMSGADAADQGVYRWRDREVRVVVEASGKIDRIVDTEDGSVSIHPLSVGSAHVFNTCCGHVLETSALDLTKSPLSDRGSACCNRRITTHYSLLTALRCVLGCA